MKCFPDRFIHWTKYVVCNGKVAIAINDVIGPYFATRKGLRQGDRSLQLGSEGRHG